MGLPTIRCRAAAIVVASLLANLAAGTDLGLPLRLAGRSPALLVDGCQAILGLGILVKRDLGLDLLSHRATLLPSLNSERSRECRAADAGCPRGSFATALVIIVAVFAMMQQAIESPLVQADVALVFARLAF